MSDGQIKLQEGVNESNNKKVTKCRWCKSMNVVKKGYRKTGLRGKIQRYMCRGCNRSFCEDNGFYRMRNNPKIITMSIDMYLSNLSSRKMRNQLRRHLSKKISHVSVLDWVRKYVLKVHDYIDTLSYNLGDSFYADETIINRNGNLDKFWACVDWDTRLITGVHYSLDCNIKEAMSFIKKSIKKGKPNYIQTDSAIFYPRAFRRLFYRNKLGGLKIKHKIQNYQKTRIHNYKIETVFSKIKDRVDDFRGLKALWSAPILLKGLVIQHNFIEPHTGINKVPCELAGQNLYLGENRWLGLIHLATTNN